MKGTHLKVLSGKKNSLEALYWLPINREKTLDPSKGRQSGQVALPVQQAEQSRGAVASQGTQGESPLRLCALPAGEHAVTAAFMAQCSSGLSQGPRPSRGGGQKRETAAPHILCGGRQHWRMPALGSSKPFRRGIMPPVSPPHILAGAKVVWITNLIALLKAQTSSK